MTLERASRRLAEMRRARLRYLVGDRAADRRAGDRPARLVARRARRRHARAVRRACARSVPMLDEDRPLGPDVETRRARCSPPARSRRPPRMTWLLRNWDQVARRARRARRRSRSTALAIAFAISLAVGIWAARNDRVSTRSRSRVAGFLYTIPTLAFLALLIPVVGPRPDERDHLHGRVLAHDPDPQHRDRHPRGAAPTSSTRRAAWA